MTIPSIEEADNAFEKKDYQNAQSIYSQLLNLDNLDSDANGDIKSKNEKLVDLKERSILQLCNIYSINNDQNNLIELVDKSCNLMKGSFAKSKTAKIIKYLLDKIENTNTSSGSTDSITLSINVTKKCIDWAIQEKRSFLKQSLQIRLALLYYKLKNFNESLLIINPLLKEFKKLDDKSSLVEIQLLESKNYFQLKNIAKSRASLTSARTSANAIYCSSITQAELDVMSGILNAENKDFETAYSYFFEAFENYQLHETKNNTHTNTIDDNDVKSIKVLKYLILCKIMIGNIDDINSLLKQKNCQPFINKKDIEAMKSVSKAYSNRSLKDLEDSLKFYSNELTLDPIIRSHLSDLYDSLFTKNLLKLIEPYSCIEINHIVSMIGLSKNIIESKLSNMILDKIFYGVIDQGNGWLIIYDKPKNDETYSFSLQIIKEMSNAVDLLYEKASSLE